MTDSTFDLGRAVLDNTGLPDVAPPDTAKDAPVRRRPGPPRAGRVVATRPASIPLSKDKAVQRYQYWGLVAALVVLELIWVALWLLNGYLSATFLRQWVGMSLGFGFIAHVAISLCEQHLPRAKATILRSPKSRDLWPSLRWIIWPLLFLVTLFDVTSSAAGLQVLAAGRSLPATGYVVIVYTLVGAFIALASERLIIMTGAVISRLVRR